MILINLQNIETKTVNVFKKGKWIIWFGVKGLSHIKLGKALENRNHYYSTIIYLQRSKFLGNVKKSNLIYPKISQPGKFALTNY